MIGKDVDKLEAIIDHERRIQNLENQFKIFETKITTIENNQLRTENTLMTQHQEVMGMLRGTIEHEQKMDMSKAELKAELTKKSKDTQNKIILAFIGASGVWTFLQYLLDKFVG